jgi:ABC-type uncharacterized transport system fused permease/ATPase subunit
MVTLSSNYITAAGIFALKGRIRLTRYIQLRYVTPTVFYPIATTGVLDNPDQRIAQDVGIYLFNRMPRSIY